MKYRLEKWTITEASPEEPCPTESTESELFDDLESLGKRAVEWMEEGFATMLWIE